MELKVDEEEQPKPMKKVGSNLTLKQNDRYATNTLEKNLFATMEESCDELKVIYREDSQTN